jgi:hypothetical protein
MGSSITRIPAGGPIANLVTALEEDGVVIVVHGAGANTTTDQWRRGMHSSYVVGWLRTEENHYLTLLPNGGPNVAATVAGTTRFRCARRSRRHGRIPRNG